MTPLEVQPVSAVSASGGLGAYDIRPRRLVELEYASRLSYDRAPSGRYVHSCEFNAPMTRERFLSDAFEQYKVFSRSTKRYYDALKSGALQKPSDVSLAGALAVLHIGGRGALQGWPKLFDNTRSLYEAAREAF